MPLVVRCKQSEPRARLGRDDFRGRGTLIHVRTRLRVNLVLVLWGIPWKYTFEHRYDHKTSTMAGLLNLSAGPPSLGMTRRDFRYASLHGDSLRQSEKPPEPSDPIFALPKGSSSDDETSDDSEFGRSEKKKPVGIGMLRTSTHSSPANGEDGKKRELSVEPSNIRPGSFTSGKGSGSRNGSQSSQKRKNADLDDDDMPFAFSQSKKPRQGYGSTNIHRGPVTKPGNPKKLLPKEREKPAPAFKKRDTSAMEARGRRPLRIVL